MTDAERHWISERRKAELAARDGLSPVVAGAHCLHRPGELILDRRTRDRLDGLLRARYEARPLEEVEGHWRRRIGVPAEARVDLNSVLEQADRVLWTVPDDPETADLPGLVRQLRADLAGDGGAGGGGLVALNHVYAGEPLYQGGPGGEPSPIPAFSLAGFNGPDPDATPLLAVLDTGLPDNWQTLHPQLADALSPDHDNRNLLYGGSGTELATQAGHGLFICALAHRAAPALRVDPGRVLDPTGIGDDASVAAELLQTQAKVVCLSLGGYTADGAPPPALAAAVAARSDDIVVVAAAGNNSGSAPFYPAALPGVIAVAGYDSTGTQPGPASFSNRGPWVDVCAPAVGLAGAYVQGDWRAHDGLRTFDGWASWSGTSFAAPQVAAEIARRLDAGGPSATARGTAAELLAELSPSPWPGWGLFFVPPTDLTQTPGA
jgi:hypothetical protein